MNNEITNTYANMLDLLRLSMSQIYKLLKSQRRPLVTSRQSKQQILIFGSDSTKLIMDSKLIVNFCDRSKRYTNLFIDKQLFLKICAKLPECVFCSVSGESSAPRNWFSSKTSRQKHGSTSGSDLYIWSLTNRGHRHCIVLVMIEAKPCSDEIVFLLLSKSKHLKGQLGPRVRDATYFSSWRSVWAPCPWRHVF